MLGSFKGEKVKAEMDFPDGHKAKNLESGKCATCSNYGLINTKYGAELEANPKMAAELREIESRVLAQGDQKINLDL